MVKNPAFQKFLKDEGFILVSWRDLAKALPADWKSTKYSTSGLMGIAVSHCHLSLACFRASRIKMRF